jgi:signal transduction histidine kinase
VISVSATTHPEGPAGRPRSGGLGSGRLVTVAGPTVIVLLLELASVRSVTDVRTHMALAVIAAGSLLWRHRAPWLVLVLAGGAPAAQLLLLGSPQTNAILAQWVACAAVVRILSWPRSLLPPAGAVAFSTGVSLFATPAGGVPDFLINVISALVAWAFGDAQARRAAARASMSAHMAELEASSALRAQDEALSERLRISDETGRLLGATLDAVLAQVRAARTRLGSTAGLQHLIAVEDEGRRALTHLDRYLDWLRLPQDQQVPPEVPPAAISTRGRWWSSPAGRTAVAAGPVALLLPLALWEYPTLVPAGASAATITLTFAQVLPLLVRSRWPLAVTVAVGAALLLQLLLGHPVHNATLALPLALHSLAQRDGRRRTAPLAASLVGALSAAAFTVDGTYATGFVTVLTVVVAVGVYTGDSAGLLQRQDEQMRDRLVRTELDDQLRVRAAVAQERLAAAQDLHDSVGHVLSLVTLQAGAARVAVSKSPEQARSALDAIERAALGALDELDVSVRASGTDSGPRVRTLADLRELADQVRAVGVPVVLRCPDMADLPGVLHETAFRLVQEGLTNVVKHAPGSTALVAVVRDGDQLRLSVRNSGGRHDAGPAQVPSGRRGLQGMRERVALFGGELVAGPQPGGGFLVRASLPVRLAAPDAAAGGVASVGPAGALPTQRAGEGAPRSLPGT